LRWLKDFLVRFFDNQFKRSCVPDGPKVGSISLSPRGDWRMPSDAEVTAWVSWVEKEMEKLPKADSATEIGKPNMTASKANPVATAVAAAVGKVYRVLVRVDIQNCFCPKGTLPVPDGDAVVPVANRLSRSGYYNAVVDSQDWHPADHGSFVSQHPGKKVIVETVTLNGVTQVVWPDHGVQNTADADFHKDLDRSMVAHTVRKGTDARVDSYSAFYDNGKGVDAAVKSLHAFLGQSTGLAEWIIAQATAAGADTIEVDVIGLATDFCVKFTALDAAGESYKGTKFKVRVVSDACRGFDAAKAEGEMKAAGIEVITSDVVAPAVAAK
jgi:nicotinamidase/pyrazinamidase